MCGILGGIYPEAQQAPDFAEALQSIHHRGPDAGSILEEQYIGYAAVFGHRRLSIIDLSESANQPFVYKQFLIVFNGEIYNYREIKEKLQHLGHSFKTTSDTEVIIHSFEEWGEDFVQNFHGMFAFCIYNKDTSETFICRDRFGVKPLYYAVKNKGLFFASELKALVKLGCLSKNIDHDAVMDFFSYGYISEPRSIFEDIRKLPAGCILKWKAEGTPQIRSYYNLREKFDAAPFTGSFEDAKQTLRPILEKAVNYRMVADVPVGIFLSGGFDSSLVTALVAGNHAANVNTFSIGFEQKEYNETQYAREVAKILGTTHHEYVFTEKECREILPKICYYYDEPFSDVSMFPTSFLCSFASQKVKVALSADGGDEIFAGYTIYQRVLESMKRFDKYKNSQLSSIALDMAQKFIPENRERLKYNIKNLSRNLSDYTAINFLEQMSRRTDADVLQELLPQSSKNYISHFKASAEEARGLSNLNSMLLTDLKGYMSNNILVKVDRASMAASLESREPLLDQDIVEFAATLPDEYKFSGGILKKILKDITYDYLPEEIMNRPKAGFTLPLFSWLKGDLKEYASYYLSPEISRKHGILCPETTAKIRKRFFSEKSVYSDLAWQIIIFNQWCEMWL